MLGDVAQAAHRPNRALNGTAMAAVSRVSWIAAMASGSTIATKAALTPFFSASVNTLASGKNRHKGQEHQHQAQNQPANPRGVFGGMAGLGGEFGAFGHS